MSVLTKPTTTPMAIALIDVALPAIASRDLVPSAEIVDLLLDVRRAIGLAA